MKCVIKECEEPPTLVFTARSGGRMVRSSLVCAEHLGDLEEAVLKEYPNAVRSVNIIGDEKRSKAAARSQGIGEIAIWNRVLACESETVGNAVGFIMQVRIDDIKRLRAETSAGVSDCRQALEDANGNYDKAKKLLIARGLEKAAKKQGKETSQGVIAAYAHATGRVGVVIELRCETDFVARTDEFKNLAHEITLQVAAMKPKDVKSLLSGAYIRDTRQTVADLVKGAIAKVGENITVARFTRFELGE